jgi:thiol-disulfide isomerase/thioredoxin
MTLYLIKPPESVNTGEESMLGKGGKSSGVVNEATNKLTNDRLNETIEYMASAEYQKQRAKDNTDVIPTHARAQKAEKREDMKVFDPAAEKAEAQREAQNDDDDDDDLAFLRSQRMAAIKAESAKMVEWKAKGHGWYREIGQDDFFSTVVREKGGSEDVAVHFFHKDFERCKLMDKHLGELAQSMMRVRFVKVNVEKAPFLVEKLKVTVLPCVIFFHNDVAVDRLLGFDELGGDEFSLAALQERVERGLRMIQN